MGSKVCCTLYLQCYLLTQLKTPLVLVLNEVNRLFEVPLIAQEFLPTPFDWRVGVIDGQVLFVCKYFMASEHWQIVNWSANKEDSREGNFECIPADQAPSGLLKTALKATALIGRGLYGVDMKEVDGKFYVIEINDNPNIDGGIEDKILKDRLYTIIMEVFLGRIKAEK